MNDCCEHNSKCRWAVGSNMPGYMPDGHVSHYANWRDARESYLDEIDRALDAEHDAHEGGTGMEFDDLDSSFQQHRTALLKHKRTTEAQFKVGQYLYWLARI